MSGIPRDAVVPESNADVGLSVAGAGGSITPIYSEGFQSSFLLSFPVNWEAPKVSVLEMSCREVISHRLDSASRSAGRPASVTSVPCSPAKAPFPALAACLLGPGAGLSGLLSHTQHFFLLNVRL